jgi:hypothetical protein
VARRIRKTQPKREIKPVVEPGKPLPQAPPSEAPLETPKRREKVPA